MAVRPVFIPQGKYPWYSEVNVEFHYAAGFALVQRQKNINAIHDGFRRIYPDTPVLEASSKSASELGKSLSPFYLQTELNGKFYPVENVFQASKVFQGGGPFRQLLDVEPVKAKTTSITKTHGAILYYVYEGNNYPIDPKGWFYDWLYMKALKADPGLASQALDYGAFTDIAFNPKTGTTCQAKCLAIYKGLSEKKKLDEALSSIPSFLKIVFKASWPEISDPEFSDKEK